MELKIAREGEWRTRLLGGSAGLHSDILAGRDCELDWEDVFVGKLIFHLFSMLGRKDERLLLLTLMILQATVFANFRTSIRRWSRS
jgi:Proteasome maturation factor UMP1